MHADVFAVAGDPIMGIRDDQVAPPPAADSIGPTVHRADEVAAAPGAYEVSAFPPLSLSGELPPKVWSLPEPPSTLSAPESP